MRFQIELATKSQQAIKNGNLVLPSYTVTIIGGQAFGVPEPQWVLKLLLYVGVQTELQVLLLLSKVFKKISLRSPGSASSYEVLGCLFQRNFFGLAGLTKITCLFFPRLRSGPDPFTFLTKPLLEGRSLGAKSLFYILSNTQPVELPSLRLAVGWIWMDTFFDKYSEPAPFVHEATSLLF